MYVYGGPVEQKGQNIDHANSNDHRELGKQSETHLLQRFVWVTEILGDIEHTYTHVLEKKCDYRLNV